MTSAGAPVRDPGAPASRPASATTPGLLGAAALTGFILILPSPEGLPPEAHRLAALFAGVLVLWSTEALPIAVTALLALALQPIFGLTSLVTGRPPTPGAIFGAAAANFMSSVFFFVLVMFAIAHAWVKTGLARRFALWLIARAGTDATRAVYVFMIGTGAISMVVSDVPAAAIFMAIAVGILDKLGLRPGSRFGRAVMIGIPIAALIGGVGTPAGSSINLLGLIMIEQAGGDRVPFLHWMAIGIPMVAILLPVAAWVLVRFFPPEIASIGDLEEIHDERRRMGPVSRAEWKVVAIMSAMIPLWIASTWLPVFDTFLVAVVGAVPMFLPGIGLFTWKEVQQVTGWDTLMVIGGVTSLGQASSQDRSRHLARRIGPRRPRGLERRRTHRRHQRLHRGHPPHAADRSGHQRRHDPAHHGPRRRGRREPGPLRAAGHLHGVVRVPAAARRRAPRHLQPGLLPDVRHAAGGSRHQRRLGRADDGAAPRRSARSWDCCSRRRLQRRGAGDSTPTPLLSFYGATSPSNSMRICDRTPRRPNVTTGRLHVFRPVELRRGPPRHLQPTLLPKVRRAASGSRKNSAVWAVLMTALLIVVGAFRVSRATLTNAPAPTVKSHWLLFTTQATTLSAPAIERHSPHCLPIVSRIAPI